MANSSDSGAKVLLCDDSATMQRAVKLSLKKQPYELLVCDNGKDGLRLAQENKPVIVLADLDMPGMTGAELCKAIKEDSSLSNTKVVLLCGRFDDVDEKSLEGVPTDGKLWKPFEAQVLIELLRTLATEEPVHNADDATIALESSPSEAEELNLAEPEEVSIEIETQAETVLEELSEESLPEPIEELAVEKPKSKRPLPPPMRKKKEELEEELFTTSDPESQQETLVEASAEPEAADDEQATDFGSEFDTDVNIESVVFDKNKEQQGSKIQEALQKAQELDDVPESDLSSEVERIALSGMEDEDENTPGLAQVDQNVSFDDPLEQLSVEETQNENEEAEEPSDTKALWASDMESVTKQAEVAQLPDDLEVNEQPADELSFAELADDNDSEDSGIGDFRIPTNAEDSAIAFQQDEDLPPAKEFIESSQALESSSIMESHSPELGSSQSSTGQTVDIEQIRKVIREEMDVAFNKRLTELLNHKLAQVLAELENE